MTDSTPSPTSSACEPHAAAASCRIAETPGQVASHHLIRHEVFVVEQAVFATDDTDESDVGASTIKVVAYCEDYPAGAVRLYPRAAGRRVWQGDRLAVRPAFRRRDVGGPLVDFAVATAARRGGGMMTAHVQVANVRFFEALGWRRAGAPEIYVGRPHQPMAIDLEPGGVSGDADR